MHNMLASALICLSAISLYGQSIEMARPSETPKLLDDTALVYNVKTAGATGNGISDDTAAITAAIRSAAAINAVLYFPPGTYLSCGITLSPSVKLYGPPAFGRTSASARLKATKECATPMISGPKNLFDVTIENLHFDGNGTARVGVFIDAGISWNFVGNSFANFPLGAAHIKGGSVLYMTYEHNKHADHGYALDFQNNYSSVAAATYYGCNVCWIEKNIFNTDLGIRVGGGNLFINHNDFEPLLASPAVGVIDLTDPRGYPEVNEVSYNYFELKPGASALPLQAIYSPGRPLVAIGNAMYNNNQLGRGAVAINNNGGFSSTIQGNLIKGWDTGIQLGPTLRSDSQQLIGSNWFRSVKNDIDPPPTAKQAMTAAAGQRLLSLPTGTFVVGSALVQTTCSVPSGVTTLDLAKCNDFYLDENTPSRVSDLHNGQPGEEFTVSSASGNTTLATSAFNLCESADYKLPPHEIHSFKVDFNGVVREICSTPVRVQR